MVGKGSTRDGRYLVEIQLPGSVAEDRRETQIYFNSKAYNAPRLLKPAKVSLEIEEIRLLYRNLQAK